MLFAKAIVRICITFHNLKDFLIFASEVDLLIYHFNGIFVCGLVSKSEQGKKDRRRRCQDFHCVKIKNGFVDNYCRVCQSFSC